MGNYISFVELNNYKVAGSTIDISAYSTPEIISAIDHTESFIEYTCGDIFYPKADIKYFDGNGNYKLFLPPTSVQKILAINSVVEVDFDGVSILHTFIEDVDFKKYDYYLETARAMFLGNNRARITGGGVWPAGQKNIRVDGTWGSANISDEIKFCTTVLTLERLKPGCTKMSSRDVKQVVWSDFTVTFSGSSTDSNLTGFIEVDRILSRHVNMCSMFLAAPTDPFSRGITL